MSNLPAPRGKRARRKYEESIRKLAGYIEAMLRSAAAAQPEHEQPTAEPPKQKTRPKQDTLPGQIAMDLPQGTG